MSNDNVSDWEGSVSDLDLVMYQTEIRPINYMTVK